MSAILHPCASPPREPAPTVLKTGTAPILWADWSRRLHRRQWIELLRTQRVDVLVHPPPQAETPSAPQRLSRAERRHWRLNWQERLACNARGLTAPFVQITLFGLAAGFAAFLGLPTR